MFPSPSCPQPPRGFSSSCTTFFTYTEFPEMWCQIGAPTSPQRCGRTSAGGNGELVLQLPSPNQAGQLAPRVYAEMCHQPLIVEQPRPLDQICLQLELAWQLAYLLLRPLWATSHPMFLYQKEITVPFVQHHLR